MKFLFMVLMMVFAIDCLAARPLDDDEDSRAVDESRQRSVPYQQGQPLINQYGQPYQYAPANGAGGGVLGPVTPNAYGTGLGMDATGKPVRAVPY